MNGMEERQKEGQRNQVACIISVSITLTGVSATYNVSDVMVDIFKEAIALGESGPAVLHQIEGTQLTKRGQQLLYLKHKD